MNMAIQTVSQEQRDSRGFKPHQGHLFLFMDRESNSNICEMLVENFFE